MRAKYGNPDRDKEMKGRIIAAAEYVFAEIGLEKATLREITARAEVNVAAVSYYFGSKSDLVHSVFDQLSTRLNERRVRDLDECLAKAKCEGKPPNLRSVLDVFIRPYLDGKSGRLFARLVLQHRLSPSDLTQAIITGHFDPMAKRFIKAIADACPNLDPKMFYWRYAFMIGSVVYTVADSGALDRAAHLSEGKVRARKTTDLHDALLDFLVAGMRHDPASAGDPLYLSSPKALTRRGKR